MSNSDDEYGITPRKAMKWLGVIGAGVSLSVLLIFGIMAGYAKYSVWSKAQSGKAVLAEAESSRKVAIEEANAKRDAATALAEAERIRAKGLADANGILGASLQGEQGARYLQYLWITEGQEGERIYVPMGDGGAWPQFLESGQGAAGTPKPKE